MTALSGRILVAVVNYRSHQHVAALLRSLAVDPPHIALIVDNGSGGEEPDALRRSAQGFGFASVVVLPDNRGFGAGVNAAVERLNPSDEDVIWILNPDTEVPPGTGDMLRQGLAAGVDVVSPQIITGAADRPLIWFDGGDIDLLRGRTQHRRMGAPFVPSDLQSPIDCSFITGAAPMLTGRAWRALDGLREDLFLYWEDADMSFRALERGLRMAVVPGAVVWHARGGSSDDEGHSPTYFFHMQRNRLIVLGDQGLSWWRLVLGSGAIETARLLLRPLRQAEGRRSKAMASIRGLASGIRLANTANLRRERH